MLQWLRDLLARLRGPAPTPAPVPTPTPSDVPGQIEAEVNRIRRAAGLRALAHDPGLASIAQEWAADDAAKGVLTHGDFASRIATAHPHTAGAENIAQGYATATAVCAGWMASPGHRANILGDWDLIGCGWAPDRRGNAYAVADFDRE